MARKPANILFVNHTAEIIGPSNSLLMLLRHLRDRQNTAVLLREDRPPCKLLEKEGIEYFIIPTVDAKTIPKIFRLISWEGFDLIYENSPSDCPRNAILAADARADWDPSLQGGATSTVNCLDIVATLGEIDLLEQPAIFLAQASSVMKPGGTSFSARPGSFRRLESLRDQAHVEKFTPVTRWSPYQ